MSSALQRGDGGQKRLDAIVLTGPAFDAAERANVTGIEVDLQSMAHIAHHVGHIAAASPGQLPSQFFIGRDSSTDRDLVSRWDTRVPVNANSPLSERYFWARDLGIEHPRSSDRAQIIEVGQSMGVSKVIELSFATWVDESDLARVYAAGLLFGRRPLDPQTKGRSLARDIARDYKKLFTGKLHREMRALHEVDDMAKAQQGALRPPFVLHRRQQGAVVVR